MTDDDDDPLAAAPEAFAEERPERWREFIDDEAIKEMWETREAEAWDQFVRDWLASH